MNTHQARAASRRRKQKIHTILVIAGILLVLITSGFLLYDRPVTPTVGPAEIGKPLADFSLSDINGRTVHLSDYKGRVVLINAWATWCPPCKAEMPDLNAFYQAYQDTGFVILAVNGGDPASQAAAFASQVGLTFPVLLDPEIQLLDSLGIRSFPTSILVGADGIVKTIHFGMFTPEMLEKEIAPYLTQ